MNLYYDANATATRQHSTRSYAVNIATAADHTIMTPKSGARWVLYQLFLKAEGAVSVTIKSASTAVSGSIELEDAVAVDLKNGGFPVAKGLATGSALVLTLDGAVQVNGMALVGEATG